MWRLQLWHCYTNVENEFVREKVVKAILEHKPNILFKPNWFFGL